MNIKMIAARSENGFIGKDGEIPWDYPEDVQYFKDKTMEDTVIMGRRTFESSGPVPGRECIVLTTTENYTDQDVKVARNKKEALQKSTSESTWICGGEGVYEGFMYLADKIFLSEIPETIDGDTRFPEIPDVYGNYETIQKDTFKVKKFVKISFPQQYRTY